MTKYLNISDDLVSDRIYFIRKKRVMLDRDLAELYGVETRALNQAVKRNEKRFPDDFMFQLTPEEMEVWKSQFVTSNSIKLGMRKPPMVFTEQGVSMLSSVLNSERAIMVNIQIIRIFTRMRELVLTHKDILLKLEQIEKKMLKQDIDSAKNAKEIQVIFQYLKELINPPTTERKKIGFKNYD
jgi:ORF6N domain